MIKAPRFRIGLILGLLASMGLAACANLSEHRSAASERRINKTAEALSTAYPGFVERRDGNRLIMRDGTAIVIDDGNATKTPAERLSQSDLEDTFAYPYPKPGAKIKPPRAWVDPGRVRSNAFLDAVYGDCTKTNIVPRLARVAWVGGSTVRFHEANGAAAALERVGRDLEKLPERFRPFMNPIAGTFNCRTIAGTDRRSMHAYGLAIDLNNKFGEYWRDATTIEGNVPYRNRFPIEIVEVFERHGFVWGGRWHHYDTFHFEYRPEFLAWAKAK